ncbi:MAG: RNA ligase family protein [Actinomycetota bacterium]|uniref:RNA ligase family protein n=1 Tax=Mycobacterium lentiflavum TaxID=141349 RepID=A0ABY3UXN8_MYCLN|nr:RNA ligase family protein [Mycobacterium lentiflavum]MEE3065437.1 RNA ligase family protein [Actinomycetota bacterium]ULP42479.1 RNA ligase family protein [Mycobacterium lentiflavum]
MTAFIKFPSTPYLVRPPGTEIRGDKVLTNAERDEFLATPLHIEEKIDGQNLGISNGEDGLRFQARGSYVEPGGRHFRGLETWIAARRQRLAEGLSDDLILFGEWCAVKHTVRYDSLPDWLLVFDVYERAAGQFWEPEKRDALAEDLGLYTVPFLGAGHYDLNDLTALMSESRLGHELMEGIVARSTTADGPRRRAKLIRPGFVQQIDQHWMSGQKTMNRLALAASD